MNRFSFFVIFILTASFLAGKAQSQTVTAYSAIKSDYSFVEFGFVQDQNPVVQSGITFSGEDCFADFWASSAIDFGNEGNEIDYSLGCGTKVGEVDLKISFAYFDLPTPSATDFDLDSDIIRLQAEIGRTITLSENDSLRIWAGGGRITGLIETWSIRTGADWIRDFDSPWSSTVGIGVSHQTHDGYTGAWGRVAVDYQLPNRVSVGSLVDWYAGETGQHATFGMRISKSW